MNDTTLDMTARQDQLCAAKSPAERLRMGCSMFSFSRELVRAGILRNQPNISRADLKAELFRAFYGEDFNKEEMDRILTHLRNFDCRAGEREKLCN